MGFAVKFAALDPPAVEVRGKLCPLLFLQFTEEEWEAKYRRSDQARSKDNCMGVRINLLLQMG